MEQNKRIHKMDTNGKQLGTLSSNIIYVLHSIFSKFKHALFKDFKIFHIKDCSFLLKLETNLKL